MAFNVECHIKKRKGNANELENHNKGVKIDFCFQKRDVCYIPSFFKFDNDFCRSVFWILTRKPTILWYILPFLLLIISSWNGCLKDISQSMGNQALTQSSFPLSTGKRHFYTLFGVSVTAFIPIHFLSTHFYEPLFWFFIFGSHYLILSQ